MALPLTYAVAGIRKELYIWAVKTGELVKCLDAHFARIIDLQSLVVGPWNCVITSSIDRTVKVWNINYIFEQVHHIDRHEMQIDSLSVCTKAGIAVATTAAFIKSWWACTINVCGSRIKHGSACKAGRPCSPNLR